MRICHCTLGNTSACEACPNRVEGEITHPLDSTTLTYFKSKELMTDETGQMILDEMRKIKTLLTEMSNMLASYVIKTQRYHTASSVPDIEVQPHSSKLNAVQSETHVEGL